MLINVMATRIFTWLSEIFGTWTKRPSQKLFPALGSDLICEIHDVDNIGSCTEWKFVLHY